MVDTGINRLGLPLSQLGDPLIARLDVDVLMSHLACADEPDHAMNPMQLANFHAMTDGTGLPRSLAATGGILLGPRYHFDLTRPGVGLYGGSPYEAARPVGTLSLPVIQTRDVAVGEPVGYSCTWVAEQPSVVATVAAGYADGLSRGLSNNAVLWDGDTPCPLIGRVSMDLVTADVTALIDIGEGDWIDVDYDLTQAAALTGLSQYELLTNLGQRFERVWV